MSKSDKSMTDAEYAEERRQTEAYAEVRASALSRERREYVVKTVFAWLSSPGGSLPEGVNDDFLALGNAGRLGMSIAECDDCCGGYVGAIALRDPGPVPKHIRDWLWCFANGVLRDCCGRAMTPPYTLAPSSSDVTVH